jgi:hypothetical protein
MELENDDEANQACTTLQKYLQMMGIKEADVYFNDEAGFKKEH